MRITTGSPWTLFVIRHTKKPMRMNSIIRPTTAELRRWMHDPSTPRAIKCKIWSMLGYRRAYRA